MTNATTRAASVADRFLGEAECARITNLSRTTRWRLTQRQEFPQRVEIAPGRCAWLESEVLDWVAKRVAKRVPVGSKPEAAG